MYQKSFSVTAGLSFRYSTVYTMFPVFSLVLDKDVKSEVAMLYPELYKDLLKVFKMSKTQTHYEQEDCQLMMCSCLSAGPAVVFQDLSHMGADKYLPR